MARTLLQIVTAALSELGLPAPTAVVGNRDGTALQCLSLLNLAGEELADMEGGWPGTRGEQTIALVAGQEAYDFPTDLLYYRWGAGLDEGSRWMVWGSLSARAWQELKFGFAVCQPFTQYRIMNGQIHFSPTPASAGTLDFEYVSANWVQGTDGVGKSMFTADSDVCLLPDRLMIMSLKWRLLAAKGMNYAEERDQYDKAADRKKARAETAEPLPLNRRRRFGREGAATLAGGTVVVVDVPQTEGDISDALVTVGGVQQTLASYLATLVDDA